MMLELSRILDREVETSIKRGLTLLEPLLILTLGMMIAGIIVSILMGILSVNDPGGVVLFKPRFGVPNAVPFPFFTSGPCGRLRWSSCWSCWRF